MESHGLTRMEEILGDYYGIHEETNDKSESSIDVNSPHFDSDAYVRVCCLKCSARLNLSNVVYQSLLRSCNLNELLRKDDQLIREIKSLDTNMQMLVYENYNKFISATDSIRKMKVRFGPHSNFTLVLLSAVRQANAASMVQDVLKVVKSMDIITRKSEEINVALAPHRIKVQTYAFPSAYNILSYVIIFRNILDRKTNQRPKIIKAIGVSIPTSSTARIVTLYLSYAYYSVGQELLYTYITFLYA